MFCLWYMFNFCIKYFVFFYYVFNLPGYWPVNLGNETFSNVIISDGNSLIAHLSAETFYDREHRLNLKTLSFYKKIHNTFYIYIFSV